MVKDPGGILPKWSRRRWLFVGGGAGGLALAVAAGLLLPDAGLRWAVVSGFQKLGMATVDLSDADLSLFGGRAVLKRLEAHPGSGSVFGLEAGDLVMRWGPLFHKRVSVENLALDGLNLDIKRDGGKLVISGLPLPAASGAADTAGPSPWSFDADALHLTGSTIRYSDQNGTLTLDVEALDLDSLRSWDPATPLHIHFKGRIDGAPVELAGTAKPFAPAPSFDVTLTADNLDLAPLAKLAGVAGIAGRLGATVAAKGSAESDGLHLEATGRLDGRQLVLAAAGADLATETLSLEATQLQVSPDGVAFAGKAALERLKAKQADTEAEIASLALNTQELAFQAKADSLDWRGDLAATVGKVVAAGVQAAPGKLSWQGRVQGQPAKVVFHFDGQLTDDAGAVDTDAVHVDLRHAAVSGKLDLAPGADGALAVTTDLSADAAGVAVGDRTDERDLAAVDALHAEGLRLQPGKPVVLAKLEAHALTALRGRPGRKGGAYPWRVELASARLDQSSVAADGGLVADALALDGLVLRLTRTGDGFVGLSAGGQDGKDSKDGKDGKGSKGGANPRLALGRLAVTGRSQVNFEDRSLGSPVKLQAADLKVTASNLDSAQPQRDSPFQVKARIGAATIAASGSVRPFAPQLSGKLDGQISAFELPPLSPYVADTLGMEVQTGHFDGTLAAAVSNGALDGKLDLTLSNLAVAPPPPDAPVAKQAGMPVGTVLDLLRDSDDNIRLSIPFAGNLADPQFDVSDAVSKAVGGALKGAAMTTLKVLFPVAALIEMAADDSGGPGLAPLAFTPGEDALDSGDRDRLETVGKLMQERPSLALTVCGAASVETDWPVILDHKKAEQLGMLYKLQKMTNLQAKPEEVKPDEAALADLAQRRADAVKAWLGDKAGIDPGRLYACRPAVEPQGKPRVDLML